MITPARTPRRLAAAALILGPLIGCGEASILPPAQRATEEEVVTLYALTGTPLETPSAYDLVRQLAIRTDRSTELDFAFEIDTAGQPLLMPRGALGLSADGGVQRVSAAYDSLTMAPRDGYRRDSTVAVDSGAVYALASRQQPCGFVSASLYAKAVVEALDLRPSSRSISLRLRINPNCGYRGLEPGVPRR